MNTGMTCRKCGSDVCALQRMWPVRTIGWVEGLVNMQQKCRETKHLNSPLQSQQNEKHTECGIQTYSRICQALVAWKQREREVIRLLTL